MKPTTEIKTETDIINRPYLLGDAGRGLERGERIDTASWNQRRVIAWRFDGTLSPLAPGTSAELQAQAAERQRREREADAARDETLPARREAAKAAITAADLRYRRAKDDLVGLLSDGALAGAVTQELATARQVLGVEEARVQVQLDAKGNPVSTRDAAIAAATKRVEAAEIVKAELEAARLSTISARRAQAAVEQWQ